MVFSWSPAGLIWLPSSSRDTGIIDGNRGKQVLLFVGSWGVGETILSKVTFLVWDSWDMADMGWWLQDHPLWQDLKLDKIQQFVLDECDKCLDKVDMRKDASKLRDASLWSRWDPVDCPRGLHQDVQQIFLETPKKKQVDDGWAVGHVSAGFRKAFFFFSKLLTGTYAIFGGLLELFICLFVYLLICLLIYLVIAFACSNKFKKQRSTRTRSTKQLVSKKGPNKNPLSPALGQRHPIQTPKSRTANERGDTEYRSAGAHAANTKTCPWGDLARINVDAPRCVVAWTPELFLWNSKFVLMKFASFAGWVFFSWPHVIFLGEISFSLETSHLCCFSPHFFVIFQSRTAFPALRTASFDVYQRQVMMFSATMSAETRQLCKKFMQAPGHGVTITCDIFANQHHWYYWVPLLC